MVQPAVCGWLTDVWGERSHVVLTVCGALLAVLQLLMLATSSVAGLGALFLIRGVLINQALDQALKALAVRADKQFRSEARREREVQRAGNASDVLTSVLEIAVMAAAVALPEQAAGTAVLAASGLSAAILAGLAFSYPPGSFTVGPGAGEAGLDGVAALEDAGSGAKGAACGREGRQRCGEYVRRGCGALCGRRVLGPLLVYAVTSTAAAVAIYPFAVKQAKISGAASAAAQAEGGGAAEAGECSGVLRALFEQRLIGSVLYLVAGVAYGVFVAPLSPRRAYRVGFPVLAALLAAAALLALLPGITSGSSSALVALLDVGTYYGGQFGVWLITASVPSDLYGFAQTVIGVILALEGVLAAGLMSWLDSSFETVAVLLVALLAAVAALSCLVAPWLDAGSGVVGEQLDDDEDEEDDDDDGAASGHGGGDGVASPASGTGLLGSAPHVGLPGGGFAGDTGADDVAMAGGQWGGLELAELPEGEAGAGAEGRIRDALDAGTAAGDTFGEAESEALPPPRPRKPSADERYSGIGI